MKAHITLTFAIVKWSTWCTRRTGVVGSDLNQSIFVYSVLEAQHLHL